MQGYVPLLLYNNVNYGRYTGLSLISKHTEMLRQGLHPAVLYTYTAYRGMINSARSNGMQSPVATGQNNDGTAGYPKLVPNRNLSTNPFSNS